MKLFIDTSAFYALADMDDFNHNKAVAAYREVIDSFTMVTSVYILAECWFLFDSRLGRDKALDFWDFVLSGVLELLTVEPADLHKARRIIEDYSDQNFSLVDATSFALIEREEISTAFTFDHHFLVYRLKGEKAINILP